MQGYSNCNSQVKSPGSNNGYRIEEKDGIKYITFDIFTNTGLVRHAFSTRHGGVSKGCYESLNLGLHVGDSPENVISNRAALCAALGSSGESLVAGKQVHGDRVAVVGRQQRGSGFVSYEDALPETDALVTGEKGVLLSSYYADCVPVMLLDPSAGVVALAHAGWKGTVAGIAGKTVDVIKQRYNCDTSKLLAVIGPSVGPCCYEVGSQVAVQFQEKFSWGGGVLKPAPEGKYMLDLWRANREILLESGLLVANIYVCGLCTSCQSQLFFSYRAQAGCCGRMASLIELI